ncbi:MAG: autotransporter-associated beta strand repeat-containing protein [Candidatus Pacebacteria bacterium]|nr:autotransporter-associated beta strand repeat-containing protein [Candidatus Paceibacterota bacterium]
MNTNEIRRSMAAVILGMGLVLALTGLGNVDYTWVGGDGNWSDIYAETGTQGWDSSPYPQADNRTQWEYNASGLTVTIDVDDAKISVMQAMLHSGSLEIKTTDSAVNKLSIVGEGTSGRQDFGSWTNATLTFDVPVVISDHEYARQIRSGKSGDTRVIFKQEISGDGSLNLNCYNSGYCGGVAMQAANTYTGDTFWYSGTLSAPLRLEHTHALQNSSLDVGGSDITSTNRVRFIAEGTHVLGGLTGSRDVPMDGKTVHIGNNDASTIYSGTLSDGALGKIGSGTLTLNGANTYTGDTTVMGGTLILGADGSLASPTISVDAGATFDVSAKSGFNLGNGQTLSGMGTVTGAVSVANGASLAPGDSPGSTVYTSDQTWGGGGIYEWEIQNWTGDTPAVDWDLIEISDTESDPALAVAATDGDPFIIKVMEYDLTNFSVSPLEQTFEVLRADGGITGVNANYFTFDTSSWSQGGRWGITQDGNSLYLTYIPEPSTLALLGLAMTALLNRRRR